MPPALRAYGSARRAVLLSSSPKASCFWCKSIVPLKLDFAAQKKGAWPSRPCGDWSTLARGLPIGAMDQAKAHRRCLRLCEPMDRRDALCSSPQVQKQAAFGITHWHRVSGWRPSSSHRHRPYRHTKGRSRSWRGHGRGSAHHRNHFCAGCAERAACRYRLRR